jgi:pantoate--beta-alanine ligase
MREARRRCDYVVVSVFVNLFQFGADEDLERYPRDQEHDTAVCREEAVDLMFLPSVDELYPEPQLARVRVDGLTDVLCGASRPEHFEGVITVVAKLFNVVDPDQAFFGQKDAQQAIVIEKMVQDLNFDLQVVRVPTVRERDGLAVSSRNIYLDEAERQAAVVLYHSLLEVESKVRAGWRSVEKLERKLRETLESEPLARVDYAQIVDLRTLESLEVLDRPALAAVAVFIGDTRLIDNIILDDASKVVPERPGAP